MVRFAAKALALAALAYPIWVYREHFEGLEVTREWVRHTHEAQRASEMVIRHSGCRPDAAALARDVALFASKTADNPAQVEVAAKMKDALARGDLGEVSRLGEVAEAEEDRLLEIRREINRSKLSRIRDEADRVVWYVAGLVVLLELIDFVGRVTRPPQPKGGP